MIDITKQLLPHEWIHIPQDVRQKMIDLFSIPKSGAVSVIDNVVHSDGRTLEDLQAMSVPKMQKFTESDIDDFRELLALTIKKITHVEENKESDTTKAENKGGDSAGNKSASRSKKVSKAG